MFVSLLSYVKLFTTLKVKRVCLIISRPFYAPLWIAEFSIYLSLSPFLLHTHTPIDLFIFFFLMGYINTRYFNFTYIFCIHTHKMYHLSCSRQNKLKAINWLMILVHFLAILSLIYFVLFKFLFRESHTYIFIIYNQPTQLDSNFKSHFQNKFPYPHYYLIKYYELNKIRWDD